jgi:tetratricopeptide (TPR) repeat protein
LRLLASVLPLIDAYCICDTGSTDNTKELIRDFFENQPTPIPGVIVEEPFRDFGYNRTYALNACREHLPNIDYVLLLDADMILCTPTNKESIANFKQGLCKDYYHVFQGSPTYYYKNVRMVKNGTITQNKDSVFSYWGVTHEYVNAPQGAVSETIQRDVLFINDVGDGGAKGDKSARDIRLLEKGLQEHPNNDRYTFYLANTYRDAGMHEKAVETYKKRIDIGGWIEEIWQSNYSMGKSFMEMGEDNKAIIAWLGGYNAYPSRIENLHRIIEYFRVRGKNQLAYEFFKMADRSRRKYTNWSEYLFLERDIYDYKVDYEFSIVGYYIDRDTLKEDGYDLIETSMKVLNYAYTPGHIFNNVFSNYKFYAPKLASIAETIHFHDPPIRFANIGKSLFDTTDFVSSTPSILRTADHSYVVNVRFVNYRIDGAGNYVNHEHIITHNVIAVFNANWELQQEFLLEYDRSLDGRYVGLEDVRLFYDDDGGYNKNGTIRYVANRGIDDGAAMRVEIGEISLLEKKTEHSRIVESPENRTIEKNWTMFMDPRTREIKYVYSWFPLIIGTIADHPKKTEFIENADHPEKTEFIENVDHPKKTEFIENVDHPEKTEFIENADHPKKTEFIENADHPKKTELIETHRFSDKVPSCMRNLRGSTNGIFIPSTNEIWFLAHSVNYEDRRYYYHTWVILDAATYECKRCSPFFTFEGEKVEYTLGLAYGEESDEFIVGYSVLDRTTQFLKITRSKIL